MIGGNLFYFLIRRENGLNDRLKLVKNGRKETEIERNKNESQETRNELKVSDLETYPLKNEERMKNGEERRKIIIDLLTETPRKHYKSTSTRVFFTETCFLPKIAEMHSLGVMNIFETAPLPYL